MWGNSGEMKYCGRVSLGQHKVWKYFGVWSDS